MHLPRRFRYTAATEGSIAVVAAVVIFVLCLAVGATIDYARMTVAKSTLEGALDSATLAAGRDLATGTTSTEAIEAKVRHYLKANVEANGDTSFAIESVAVTVDTAVGSVRAQSKASVPLAFAGLIGMETGEVGAVSSTTYSKGKIEVSLVLDVTGSMDGQKIADLRSAATSLVNSLMPADGSMAGRVRIAVVPFAASVNAATYAAAATGGVSGKGCATERTANALNDQPPTATLLGRATTDCPTAAILPLSGDSGAIKTLISGFKAGGATAGHIGLAWGWYTLSPNWGTFWPAASTPAAYSNTDATKIVVFMTDGDFNTWYATANGNSTAQAKALCDGVKAAKIRLYTIGFKVSNAAHTMMSACASTPSHYFDAKDGAQLVAVFDAIAREIRSIWLSS